MSAAEEMDQADEELRETIRHIWPLQARKILDLLIPKSDCGFFYFSLSTWGEFHLKNKCFSPNV